MQTSDQNTRLWGFRAEHSIHIHPLELPHPRRGVPATSAPPSTIFPINTLTAPASVGLGGGADASS